MDQSTGVFAREPATLDRAIEIGIADGRLLSVAFPETPGERDGDDHPLLDRIGGVLAGDPDSFEDVPVALTLPTDRRRVLEALRGVPHGESVGMADLARMTAGLDPDADDARATVEGALRNNPAPVVIPDHRVADGPHAAPTSVTDALRRVEGL